MKLDLCCVVTFKSIFHSACCVATCEQRSQGAVVCLFSPSVVVTMPAILTELGKREGRCPVFCTSLYERCRISVADSLFSMITPIKSEGKS